MVNLKFKQIVEFIRELFNEPEGNIPLHSPIFCGHEKEYLLDCINSSFVSSVGRYVDKFEELISTFTGAKKAIACVNGTSALHLALRLVGVKPNTEVITQPLTFVATANAIRYCNAMPVFLDVDMDTMGLSPNALRKWLNNNSTKKIIGNSQSLVTINKDTGRLISACLPMHSYGNPCRIDEIVAICSEFNIPVVEDAAESLGSYYKNQHTGTFGDIGILSFNGNKIITSGGGGMLLLKDEEMADRAKHISTQAKMSHPWEFEHDEIGYNYRMPNINAALGVAQLEQLPKYLEVKQKIADSYSSFFNGLQTNIKLVTPLQDSKSNNWLNCIMLPNNNERNSFLHYSNSKGVMTRPAWKLMNELDMYKSCETDLLTNSIALKDGIINLPSSVYFDI
jgi:perosamine synthetase